MPIGRNRVRRSEISYAQRGRAAEAEAEYKAALRLSPQFTPAAVNLADLYRQLGRDGDGESVLRAAIARIAARMPALTMRSVLRSCA